MNKLDYLSSIRIDNPREIYDTWNAFGELKASNKTKVFAKDTIFQVTEEGPLKNAIIYCKYAYDVDPANGFEQIDWTTAQKEDVEGKVYFYQGVVSPNFQILLTPGTLRKHYAARYGKSGSDSGNSKNDESGSNERSKG